MKKLSFLIIAMLPFSILNAQLPVNFGPKVGFTTSKLSSDSDAIKEDFLANFQGGVFLRLGKKTYLQSEANFVTKGGLFGNNQGGILNAKEIAFSTVEIPLLLGRRLVDLKAANIRVMAGPTMSFVIDEKLRMLPDVLPTERDELKKKLEDVIWGIQAGVGVDFLMFALDIRYEWGLNDLIDDPDIGLKNRFISVSLGWKIL